ncbi:MAG: YcxB family protein [Oscillospiraceae bacterium]|nr:YcxB family protein [Oscillospiraceae bacterium]
MFDDRIDAPPAEKLAEGEYYSDKELILRGFRVFQKKYVRKNTIIQLILVFLAMVVTTVNIADCYTRGQDYVFQMFLLFFCLAMGFILWKRPKDTYNKLENALGDLEGVKYGCEVWSDRFVISTLEDPLVEKDKQTEDDADGDEGSDTPPATVIHTTNGGVEVVECDDMYVVYIRKINVYVVPKSAFTDEENREISERLSLVMGTRYRK